MSDAQPFLFDPGPGPGPGSQLRPLPALPVDPLFRIDALLVLRDALLDLGAPVGGQHDPCVLLDVGRCYPDVINLFGVARDALLSHLREEWAPERLLARILQRGDMGALRMTKVRLAAGISTHLEALCLALALGLQSHAVSTRIIGERSWGRACDVIYFAGAHETISRPAYRQQAEGPQIPLPAGWKKRARKTGKTPPWDPPPDGFAIDDRRCMIVSDERWRSSSHRRALNAYFREGRWEDFASPGDEGGR